MSSNYEYAVRWEEIAEFLPEVVSPYKSREDAEHAVKDSMFPGEVVVREITEWKPVIEFGLRDSTT